MMAVWRQAWHALVGTVAASAAVHSDLLLNFLPPALCPFHPYIVPAGLLLLFTFFGVWEGVVRPRSAAGEAAFIAVTGHILRSYEAELLHESKHQTAASLNLQFNRSRRERLSTGVQISGIAPYCLGCGLALLISVVCTGNAVLGALGCIALAWGDPAATLVGSRVGAVGYLWHRKTPFNRRTRSLVVGGNKTAAGLLGFVAVSVCLALIFLNLMNLENSGTAVYIPLSVVCAAAVGGGVAEALWPSFPQRSLQPRPHWMWQVLQDDNASIPIVSTLAAMSIAFS